MEAKQILEYINEKGFFFACDEYNDRVCKKLCENGELNSVEKILEGTPGAQYFYVSGHVKNAANLPYSLYKSLIPEVNKITPGGFYSMNIDVAGAETKVVVRVVTAGKNRSEIQIISIDKNELFYVDNKSLKKTQG